MALIIELFAVKSSDLDSIETVFSDYAKSTDGFLKQVEKLSDEYGLHLTSYAFYP